MQHSFAKLLLVAVIISFVSCAAKKVQSGGSYTVKIMTYNVHHCNPPEKQGVIDVAATAAVIKSQNADLVAVQEVDVNTGRSGKINQAEQLALKAGYKSFYFAKAMDYDGGQYGILILSRYPLSDTKTYMLPRAEGSKGGEPRVLATATVALPGGKSIRFGCTHLEAYDNNSRLLQVKDINRIARETSLPFIVAGDFNAHEGSEVIKTLDEHFTRTCNNCPATFSEGNAGGVIDFIASAPKDVFKIVSHKVIPDHKTSDHMPVVAELQFK
ncbi:MAG: endonuclease/exonuclease/phosphatase family protein [Niabella sp.]